MSYENLTRNQQELLKWMVQVSKSSGVNEFQVEKDDSEFIPKIILHASDRNKCRVDKTMMDNLVLENLLALREIPNDLGYPLKQHILLPLAFEAVQNNFVKPQISSIPSTTTNIGTLIAGNMSGGHVQSVGSNLGELKQIANDPQQFQVELFKLTDQIIDEVRKSAQVISVQERIQYEKAIQELKEELLAQHPEPSKMRKLFQTIGFLGDIEGNISLMMRIWPCVYPLLIMALEKAKI